MICCQACTNRPLSRPSYAAKKPSHRSKSTTTYGIRSGPRTCRRCSVTSAIPGHGERLLSFGDQLAQAGDEPVHPVGLVAGHHCPDVGETDEREQGVVAAVDAVEVHVGRAGAAADGSGQRPQHRRPAGARCADDAEVAAPSRSKAATSRRCSAGTSTRPNGSTSRSAVGVAAGNSLRTSSRVSILGQRLQPRLAHRGQPELVAGLGDRRDERGQVGGHADVVLLRGLHGGPPTEGGRWSQSMSSNRIDPPPAPTGRPPTRELWNGISEECPRRA